ncbi:hypothetical protein [Streptomyces gibsoniae]|uniref:Integral membrane protein n=1 Tax=Streptomyces gibsoniae TaxID=3075529 RepID=A0ABU2U1D2_9ACTN|nr:hypothetical protein [Streptomyces sp. DSM 41699]MDT0466989.1 hypothetical protein [Streptomyces sp. DSM 41699]
MVRRPVAWIVAVVLVLEAFGIGLLNWFLGTVVDRQNMSLAGLDPDAMSASSKAGGVVFGLYFALCGVAALLVAVRGRAPSGFWRIALISAAVVHAVLAAFTVGLVGWGAFAFLMVVFGLILLTLMTYDSPGATDGRQGQADPRPGEGGPGDGKSAPGETAGQGGPAPESGGPAPVTP